MGDRCVADTLPLKNGFYTFTWMVSFTFEVINLTQETLPQRLNTPLFVRLVRTNQTDDEGPGIRGEHFPGSIQVQLPSIQFVAQRQIPLSMYTSTFYVHMSKNIFQK